MSNKIWVLTYTIGTNEGRKSRRLICDTKERAIRQQTVLGGELVEYLRKPEAFKVNWPEGMDINGALASLRELQNNPEDVERLSMPAGGAGSEGRPVHQYSGAARGMVGSPVR